MMRCCWHRSLQSAALLSITLFSAAQQPLGSPAGRASSPSSYRISGKVVDAHSASPLAHCSVQIADVKDRGQPLTTTSADDGSFSFSGLPPGKYSLTAERRGYLTQAYQEHEQFSTAIATGPGLASENLVFSMTAEALIGGTVTDEAGEPVRGAQVRLFADQNATGVRFNAQAQSAVTDDRGIYEILGLKPGAYFLVVSAHPWYAQQVQVPNGGPQELDVAYPITYYPGVADQDAATPIPVKGGDHLEANITLAALPALRLHVNVPISLPGQHLSIMLSQTIFGQTESVPTQLADSTENGYEISGVVPGHYEVSINRFSSSMRRPESTRFEADVAAGSTELSEESAAAGEITVTGKVVPAMGRLPANAGVSFSTPHHRSFGEAQFGRLNQAGEFSVTVSPGTYEVIGNIEGMYIAGMKAAGGSLVGRTLTLKAGDTPRLTIIAGSGDAVVEGTATRRGKPASAVMVLLAPDDPAHNEVLFRRDQSDSDGTFTLPGVIPGKYRLLAIENGWNLEWANPAVLQAFVAKSVAIEIKAGEHLNRTIEAQGR